MHVVFVASEMVPFSQAGGLGDVVGSLSAALAEAGRKVTVVLPVTGDLAAAGVSLSRRLLPLEVELGGTAFSMEIFEGRLSSGVEAKLLSCPDLFERDGIYTDDPEEAVRWAALSRGALELLVHDGEAVDVIHVHDWHTALVPHYLEQGPRGASLSGTATVLTIHNLRHQGTFGREMVDRLGLSWDRFDIEGFEYFGKVNVLKAGIVSADAVTTVSPTYAREILTPAEGVGLDGLLRSLPGGVRGILNGIDTVRWDPATDTRIASRYDTESPAGKRACKGALQALLDLPERPEAPLVGMVSRLVAQKGVDLVLDMAPRLLRSDVQLVVLGDGQEELVRGLERLASRYPAKVAFRRGFDQELSSKVFAGSDIFLVPSRFEPCGLSQMIAMRYGAVPVVRRTGGLADTVVDVDRDLRTGNGFVFDDVDAVDLLGAVLRAVVSHSTSGEFGELVRRVMSQDFSWRRSAGRYASLYDELVSRG
jgi:starch synthase